MCSSRFRMVVHIRYCMEWDLHDANSKQKSSPILFVHHRCIGLQGLWSHRAPQAHITVQELIPIVIAAALWGRRWSGQTVQVWCDNEAAVSIINTGTSMDLEALHLMRCLAFISAKFQFYLFATHVQGKRNVIADALSRNKMHLFRSLYPQAHMLPTEIPEALLDLLIIRKPDWRSPIWTTLWNSIFSME